MTTRQGTTPPWPTAPSPVALGLQHQAAATPDRVALTDGERIITFAEFESSVATAASRIAAIPVPRRSGSQADAMGASVLPIVVDRTYRSAIAVHAAIRAGRAFAAVDSTLPPARLEELFFCLGAPAYSVVADPAMASVLPGWVRAVDLGCHSTDTGGLEPAPVEIDAPGCVLFTSGSSGRPKGVVRRWGALPEKLTTETGPQPASAQVQPFSFAVGLGQLVRLAAGDTQHLADVRRTAAEQLVEWLVRREIGSLNIGVALTATLVRVCGGARLLPQVTTVYLAGEPVTWDLIAPLRSLVAPEASVVSYFATSEAGEVMRYRIGPDDPIETGALPIGDSSRSDRVRLEPIQGPDSPMEMIVRDPAAIEYLGEPELTRERFFTSEDGTRWWRSGDTVSVDERGRYVHRGRIDDMVKINGRRVEPREAETAVRALPGVREAAVVVYTTAHDRRMLVAHLVIDDERLTPVGVRQALGLRLPGYLVPAVLMRHGRLPVTDRGKVDVAALRMTLPVPWRGFPPRKSYAEIDHWIAGLVTRLVDIGEVAVDDDIWAVGLDSLGAVELCAAIADAGHGEIEPPALMRHRTPAALGRFLTEARPLDPSPAVVLNTNGARPALFAIPGGGGTALAFRSLADALGADQPLVVVEPRGMHQAGTVALTIEAMADDALECVAEGLGQSERCVVLGYSAGATLALEVCRRLLEIGRPTHLVLLDGVPRGRRSDGLDEELDRGPVDDPIPAGSSGIAPDDLFANRMSVFRGGGAYYDEFSWIQQRATAGYQLRPVPVQATLIQLHNSDLAAECGRWVDGVEVHRVGGDHHTMLHPPHVEAMAAAIAAALRAP